MPRHGIRISLREPPFGARQFRHEVTFAAFSFGDTGRRPFSGSWRTAANGALEMVRWLAENGADLNAKTADGLTVIHCAAASGNQELVYWLIDQPVFLTETQRHKTILHFAARRGDAELFDWLLEHGAVCVQKAERNRLQAYAVRSGNLMLARKIREEKLGDISSGYWEKMCLANALASGNPEMVRWMEKEILPQGTPLTFDRFFSLWYELREEPEGLRMLTELQDDRLLNALLSRNELIEILVRFGEPELLSRLLDRCPELMPAPGWFGVIGRKGDPELLKRLLGRLQDHRSEPTEKNAGENGKTHGNSHTKQH